MLRPNYRVVLYSDISDLRFAKEQMNPLINILIRTHRPDKLQSCLASVDKQTYKNYNILFHFDKGDTPHYVYNIFCNKLRDQVQDGWFFFLDDDDILADEKSLERISEYLNDPDTGVICQMLRSGQPKPTDQMMDAGQVIRGKIGTPCIFLHAKHKNISNFKNSASSEFDFATDMLNKMKVKFVKVIVVDAGRRSFGS